MSHLLATSSKMISFHVRVHKDINKVQVVLEVFGQNMIQVYLIDGINDINE